MTFQPSVWVTRLCVGIRPKNKKTKNGGHYKGAGVFGDRPFVVESVMVNGTKYGAIYGAIYPILYVTNYTDPQIRMHDGKPMFSKSLYSYRFLNEKWSGEVLNR